MDTICEAMGPVAYRIPGQIHGAIVVYGQIEMDKMVI